MTRLLLVAAVALVAVLAAAGVGAGAEWDVNPGGSIQYAIDSAGVGDTIYVHAGTYVENVDVNKRLTLIGDGAGGGCGGSCVQRDYGLGERLWVCGGGGVIRRLESVSATV